MPVAIPFIIAGVEAYGAAVATSAVVAGMMYTAAALTVVGAITHNQDLSRWGSYVGLAGGAASLATDLASGGASLGANQGFEASEATGQAGMTTGTATDTVAGGANAAPTSGASSVAPAAETTTSGGANANALSVNPQAASGELTGADASKSLSGEVAGQTGAPIGGAPDVTTGAPGSASTSLGSNQGFEASEAAGGTPAPAASSKGLIGDLVDKWAGAGDQTKAQLMKIAAGTVSGVMDQVAPSPLQKAQMAALANDQRRLQYEQDQRARLNASITGTNSSVSASNTSTPPPLVAAPTSALSVRPAGIINGARGPGG